MIGGAPKAAAGGNGEVPAPLRGGDLGDVSDAAPEAAWSPDPGFESYPVRLDAGVGPTAASLRAEIQQLEKALAARTQAWREALRQLSEVQADVAAADQRAAPGHLLRPMTSEDWDRVERSDPKR